MEYSALGSGRRREEGNRRGKRKEKRQKKEKPWRVQLPAGEWESAMTAGGQGTLRLCPHQQLLPTAAWVPVVMPCLCLHWPWKSNRSHTGYWKTHPRHGCSAKHPCHQGLEGRSDSLRHLRSHMAIAELMGKFCNSGRNVNFY